jgi:hypothetical protein
MNIRVVYMTCHVAPSVDRLTPDSLVPLSDCKRIDAGKWGTTVWVTQDQMFTGVTFCELEQRPSQA